MLIDLFENPEFRKNVQNYDDMNSRNEEIRSQSFSFVDLAFSSESYH